MQRSSHNLATKKKRLVGKLRNNWLVRSGTVEFGYKIYSKQATLLAKIIVNKNMQSLDKTNTKVNTEKN